MKKQIEEKLATQSTIYSRLELEWLLDHIGDTSPAIRDDLVYNSFGHAIMNQLLSKEDFLFLAKTILEKDLLFFRMPEKGDATLTRSFTALLIALILDADNTITSPYYHSLSTEQLQIFFNHALVYLRKERDDTGWCQEKGWFHAIAHGSELLLYAGLHDQFPKEKLEEIWTTILTVLKRQKKLFTAGEDKRLAYLMTHLILQKKIQQFQVCQWIEKLDFPVQNAPDYFRRSNMENILSSLFLQLEKEGLLEHELKTSILTFWNDY